MKRREALLVVLLLFIPVSLLAWGPTGHRIVAEIGQRHLDAGAAAKVDEILGGRRLPEVATWPDDIRSDRRWDCAAPFHFVTIPPGREYFAGGAPPEGDALRALVYFETVLSDDAAAPEAKEHALAFLVHIVGDLHQPLHNGRGCDRGGNDVAVKFFGETTNLHTVWDERLIDSEQLSFTEFADFVDHSTEPAIERLRTDSPMSWVQQSQGRLDDVYTCDASRRGDRCTCFCGDCSAGESMFGGCLAAQCSTLRSGPVDLKYGYKAMRIEMLRTQLADGGLRLSGMLNWIFADEADRSGYPGYGEYQAFKRQIQQDNDWAAPIAQCMAPGA